MIVVDIETSGGFDPVKIGVWQIGALELENPENTFLEESRIDDEDFVEEVALKVIGKTEAQLRDKSKQSQKEMLLHFFQWAAKIENRDLIAHNTPFDYGFLVLKSKKYALEFPFGHRTFDLHPIAAIKYYELYGEFFIEENSSKMNLPNVMKFCGMKDERIQVKDNEVATQGKPHNGLEDAKLEAECFSRIVYGEGLFSEYDKFPIPDYLKNGRKK